MELSSKCIRCKVKQGVIHCDECISGGIYCSSCDEYLHNLPSKKNHKRYLENHIEPMDNSNTNISPPIYKTNDLNNSFDKYKTNIQTESIPNNKSPKAKVDEYKTESSITQKYIKDIKDIYEKDKSDLLSKIAATQKELNDTRNQMGNRINYLHSHIDEINKKHETELESTNNTYLSEVQNVLKDKDAQIAVIMDALQTQKLANQEILYKLADLENIKNESIKRYNEAINEYSLILDNTKGERLKLENFYKGKIDELNDLHEKEKKHIIASYEEVLTKLNDGYNESKDKFNNYIKERENYLKDITDEHEKTVNELKEEIASVKETNEGLTKSTEDLMTQNNTLKEAYDDLYEKLNKSKRENKELLKSRNELQKKVTTLDSKMSGVCDDYEQKRGIVYGKFSKA